MNRDQHRSEDHARVCPCIVSNSYNAAKSSKVFSLPHSMHYENSKLNISYTAAALYIFMMSKWVPDHNRYVRAILLASMPHTTASKARCGKTVWSCLMIVAIPELHALDISSIWRSMQRFYLADIHTVRLLYSVSCNHICAWNAVWACCPEVLGDGVGIALTKCRNHRCHDCDNRWKIAVAVLGIG